jgi:transcriptional regulator with XRE-family HTH domain
MLKSNDKFITSNMVKEDLISIRKDIGITQAGMAELLRCAKLSYHRYESGARRVPAYIGLSAKAMQFLHKQGLLKKFEKYFLNSPK